MRSGNPIIKRLCKVLWRISSIVRYIPILPPDNEISQSVFSLIRHLCLLAFDLSAIHTAAADKFIKIRYTIIIFCKQNHRFDFTAFTRLFQSVFSVCL